MNTAINEVLAWEVLDSRGTPTVACEVRLAGGARGEASVPSGASTGTHEALELRDGGERYGGKGVLAAVANVTSRIAREVAGMDARDQRALDAAMRDLDGTPNLSRLGANAVLGVSLAAALAVADAEGVPLYRLLAGDDEPLLPMPMVNVVSGGAHARRSAHGPRRGGDGEASPPHAVDIQDVLAVPVGAKTFAEAIEWIWRIRSATAAIVGSRGYNAVLVADEGGLGPPLPSNRDAVGLVCEGIERAGLRLGDDAAIAIDVAATQFWDERGYRLEAEGRTLDAAGLVEEIASWCDAFPIVSVEDACADDDWDGWAIASKRLRGRTQLLGDDLFVTDLERLDRGIREGIGNAILVKVNQNGTVSGSAGVLRRAQRAGYAPVVSARSGETEDSWLADLAVGWRAGQIKVGSTTRSERNAKWNRLLRIEMELGADAAFAGRQALAGGA